MSPASQNLHILVTACELSADSIGADIIYQLREQSSKKIVFSGCGGDLMLRQGLTPIMPFELATRFGSGDIVWPLQYLKNMFLHRTIKKTILNHLRKNKIDAILAIDAPSFALSNTKYVKKHFPEIPHILVNPPPVWAWRKSRAIKFAKSFDLLLSLLPFEPPLFSKHFGNCHFIGFPAAQPHPLSESEALSFVGKYNLKDKVINLAYLPGSRLPEIQHLLPILAQTHSEVLKSLSQKSVRAFIVAPESHLEFINKCVAKFWPKDHPPTIIPSADRYGLYRQITASVVASGTAALELSVAQVPNVIVYKINPFIGFIVKILKPLFIYTRQVGIINIVASHYKIDTPIPECLQENCSPEVITPLLLKLIENPDTQVKKTQNLISRLLPTKPLSSSQWAAKHIISLIKDRKDKAL